MTRSNSCRTSRRVRRQSIRRSRGKASSIRRPNFGSSILLSVTQWAVRAAWSSARLSPSTMGRIHGSWWAAEGAGHRPAFATDDSSHCRSARLLRQQLQLPGSGVLSLQQQRAQPQPRPRALRSQRSQRNRRAPKGRREEGVPERASAVNGAKFRSLIYVCAWLYV